MNFLVNVEIELEAETQYEAESLVAKALDDASDIVSYKINEIEEIA